MQTIQLPNLGVRELAANEFETIREGMAIVAKGYLGSPVKLSGTGMR
jgi:hypothetical protein